ncbi:glycoside hydrolase family 9 protein [Pedosphaera parvula]|uniref:Glycoside hydrolase family 9 n=1 Tax=Pedosphaera parvula (strain Ellin514) TaxID=320771 RepID=B9X9V0_PEDPL|nr:glycoside hydrolase family 9 protein [Pedosphaera parvula]EEF63251.1 glycoside hydrolase family 9 [Pedosphaera parvula Ellin514]
MRKVKSALLGALLFAVTAVSSRAVEATWEYAVQVSANVQSSPAKITLSWPQDTTITPNSYTVYRKTLDANSWSVLSTLPGSATSYVDSSVTVGSAYEYQIVKNTSAYNGYGYIYAGINAPMTESRGKVVLLVDNSFSGSLSNELVRLQQDLTGDGWTVLRHDVSRTASVPSIKSVIQSDYNADPAKVQAVFLFGHIPVPYSGNIVPDGHIPNHQGAWPADVYYGDMTGTWTDNSVNITSADDARNHNVPGDGKFDQSTIPATVKLMVGRVDLANMPGRLTWGGPATFKSELELLRNYLNKDHKFRFNQMSVPRRAIVGDYFGIRDGEAFAASAYRSFAPFFGANNITSLPDKGTWLPTLKDNAYLCAYGCGAGSWTSVGGIGNSGQYNDGTTTDLVNADVKGVFTFVFGSWLGDWDAEDDIMRGVLATSSYGLASAWSGRPHWYMHHMALGQPIGYTARLTQNNANGGLYQTAINSAANNIHIALMGDPTLRLHPVTPVSNLNVSQSGSGVSLSWSASSDSVVGYHVFRSTSMTVPFTRLTDSPVTGTSYTDSSAASGSYIYMVRAVKLETSGSGTYYNPSQGAFVAVGNASTGGGSSDGSNSGSGTVTNTPPPVTGGGNTNSTPSGTVTNVAANVWVDDAAPTGAVLGSYGGDTWNWVSAGPAPFSGTKAVQSSVNSAMHQLYFDWAGKTLNVNSGENLFTYVYLDPANVPSEVMLEWNDGTWNHRAYWGANKIANGTDGTVSRQNMGALPTAGQWARLEVPASKVGLEGSTLRGMTYTLYGGRATWDYSGTSTLSVTNPPSSGGTNGNSGGGTITNTPPPVTNTNTYSVTNSVAWLDDSAPTGAVLGSAGGDSWNWVSTGPAPFSGTKAVQSSVNSAMHQLYFDWAGKTLAVNSGESLYTYVYLDPANVPSEVMLEWNDGTWNHRAYWGANKIANGTDGTVSRQNMGALPTAGQWARLEVPASKVGLEGSTLRGMTYTLYGGRATWDYAGKSSVSVTNTPPVDTGGSNSGSGTVTNTPPPVTGGNTNSTPSGTNVAANVWVDDAAPTGAVLGSYGGDTWNWVSAGPAPFSGTKAVQSSVNSAMHQLYFDWAGKTLNVNSGENLFTYVYLDPANVPSEVMLEWNDGTWNHRAYWGANKIANGTDGTVSRQNMGALPTAGQWARLEVPASKVGLEGSTLRGMTYTLYGGRATWDYSGTSTLSVTNPPSSGGTNGNSGGGTITNTPPPVTGGSTNPPVVITNTPGTVSTVDYTTLALPKAGDNTLHILSPTALELVYINSQPNNSTQPSTWNFANNVPSASKFTVTVDGKQVAVQSVGFKRRPLYAALNSYDLRLENSLYLKLASPVSDNQNVVVKNPDGSVFSSSMQFALQANPLRYSPAIHVNQEGYVPSFPKKAMVGYYAGDMGEMDIPASSGFILVDVNSGAQVFSGSLVVRKDAGWTYTPAPYQKVYQADFSSFKTPGEYQLVVPGMGASLPFMITEGVAMSFARAYALGMYHQRCGTDNAMPYTRFTHGICHASPVSVPSPQSAYSFTWNTIAGYSGGNSTQTAPQLKDEASQLFPFVNKNPIDLKGGHHDAGDYSKYTINVGSLTHYLMFAADSLNGVSDLDNLGIPESGDGISDVLQEAKWEADYLCKLQDSDGGFYFIVYPQNREYESNVTPDNGDNQVVWPKNTSATASAVAALAQCASSPKMKAAYPADAAKYLAKAKLGWQFLMNAVNKYGKNGAYQKITFYGDEFNDADELAWAAVEMYLATGDQSIHQKLLSWFDPSDPATWRWGWVKMFQCYGNAIRSYAFAVKSGRVQASALDATFLAKCQAQVAGAADDAMKWTQMSAYGTSFPDATKAVKAAGWYFSEDQAFDIMVAYQLNQKPEYLDAMVSNLNYEGGSNPVNMTYVTGLGWRRQRIVVSQYAANARHIMPPTGEPIGNVQDGFPYLSSYQSTLRDLCYPSDSTGNFTPFYDRWGDTWNVSTEMVGLNEARGLATTAGLAAMTGTKTQAYTAKAGTIVTPANMPVGKPVTVSFQPPAGYDLNGARIVWEANGQEPAYGSTFTFTPTSNGAQWIEVEAQWPDGRRVFATSDAAAYNNLSTVSVTATDATASRTAQDPGVWTFTRTGDTSQAMTVNFQFSGTAAKWTDYRRPQGDMPESLTIPAGAASATLTINAVSGTTWTGTETATLTISADPSYNLGTSRSASITLN